MTPRTSSGLCLLLTAGLVVAACSDGNGPGNGGPPEPTPLKFIAIQVPHATYGASTCGLAADSTVYCWGSDLLGELGGTAPDVCMFGQPCSTRPLKVEGAPKLTSLTGGRWYHCGPDMGGVPYCWGTIIADIDIGFPLGDVPTPLPGGIALTQMSGSRKHICGVTPGGQAYCWGDFVGGLRGDGTVDLDTAFTTLQPNLVSGGLTFQSLAASEYGTCGLTTTGVVHCWGGDLVGGLGNPTAPTQVNCGFGGITPCLAAPHPAAGGLTFTTLTGGEFHFCGLVVSGEPYCWGFNGSNQLSTYATIPACTYPRFLAGFCATSPVLTYAGAELRTIAAGGNGTCGIDSAGTGRCWGDNDSWQLGTVSGVLDGLLLRVIAPGPSHSCGITVDSLAYCWGQNNAGQLGNGTFAASPVPVAVVGPAEP